jgi:hypothetical protein
VDALAEKEDTGAGVIKLTPVVALDGLHRGVELSRGIGNEVREHAKSVRFKTKRKSPQIMCAIIKNDQVIFITRYIDDWGCPEITMYKIKLMRRTRDRRMKGQANMAP